MEARQKNTLAVLVASVLALAPMTSMAAIGAIDVSAATTYMEDNIGAAILAVGTVLFALAGAAVGVRWVKATFFS